MTREALDSQAGSTPHRELSFTEWVGFIAMVFGIFMAILDIQIVASSLEQIQAGLSATRDEITWVQTAYLIAEVVIIPLSGWLGRAFSTRYLFAISCAGFSLMSLLCALAWNLESMIVFRGLQGFFGGGMIPSVFAVIYVLFPPRLQPMMVIVVGLVVTIAPTAGPVLGGYLTESVSWKALFLVNLIPGTIVTLLVWLYVHVDQPEWHLLERIDFRGILYIILFLGSLQFVLEEGVRHEWFESRMVVGFTVLSVLASILMFHRELTFESPIVDFRAFRDFNFAVGCFFSFVLGIGLYTVIYLMPVYLANVKGLSSLQIGEYIMVAGVFQFFSAFVAGPLAKVMDSRLMLAMGLFLYGLGCWLNGNLTQQDAYWEFFWPQALRGFALMFCFLPINALALGTLPPEEVKNASGLYNLMRNLGGAIGLAVANTLMIQWNKAHFALLREHVTHASLSAQALIESLSGYLEERGGSQPDLGALKQVTGMTLREAEVMTINSLFHALALVFFSALLFMPLVRKVTHSDGGAAH